MRRARLTAAAGGDRSGGGEQGEEQPRALRTGARHCVGPAAGSGRARHEPREPARAAETAARLAHDRRGRSRRGRQVGRRDRNGRRGNGARRLRRGRRPRFDARRGGSGGGRGQGSRGRRDGGGRRRDGCGSDGSGRFGRQRRRRRRSGHWRRWARPWPGHRLEHVDQQFRVDPRRLDADAGPAARPARLDRRIARSSGRPLVGRRSAILRRQRRGSQQSGGESSDGELHGLPRGSRPSLSVDCRPACQITRRELHDKRA